MECVPTWGQTGPQNVVGVAQRGKRGGQGGSVRADPAQRRPARIGGGSRGGPDTETNEARADPAQIQTRARHKERPTGADPVGLVLLKCSLEHVVNQQEGKQEDNE